MHVTKIEHKTYLICSVHFIETLFLRHVFIHQHGIVIHFFFIIVGNNNTFFSSHFQRVGTTYFFSAPPPPPPQRKFTTQRGALSHVHFTVPPVWLEIKFSIGNLCIYPLQRTLPYTYSPSPRCNVHNVRSPPVLMQFTPLGRSILININAANLLFPYCPPTPDVNTRTCCYVGAPV